MDYVILSENCPHRLQTKVNELLKEGYELNGALTMAAIRGIGCIYAQSLFKKL